ncbi:hypothetical protein VTN31DRAFT_1860 [Thermomyces dupontii]|uniref:uncharacterized protein n=1 Tax=Talaromyces thermophilus TaxID=28565 RepID=UPI0037426E0E
MRVTITFAPTCAAVYTPVVHVDRLSCSGGRSPEHGPTDLSKLMAVEEANRLGFGVSYRRQPSFEWLLIDHFIVLGCKCHC